MIRGQFLRYCAVGVVGFVVDAGMLELLYRLLDLGLYSARVVSYVCAATVAWLLHRTVTFPESRVQKSTQQWMRFVVLNAAGAGLNYAVYAILVTAFDVFASFPSLAVAAGSIVALAFNFGTARSLVFASQTAAPSSRRGAGVVRAACHAAIAALPLSAVSMALLLSLNYGATHVPQSLIQGRLADGFRDGWLVEENYLPYDRTIGPHQYNDCLVLGIALLQDGPSARSALSPHFLATPDASSAPCAALRKAVDRLPAASELGSYDRYIHGLSAVAALTLAALSVGEARVLFSTIVFVLCAVGVLVGAWLAVRSDTKAYRALAVAVVCACFALFYGLQYFAPTFCYAPPAMVQLLAVLAFLAFDPLENSLASGAVFASLLGALTAYFEFLTGGAPLGLAILMGMIGASAYTQRRSALLERGVFLCSLYVFSFAACFVIKYSLVALFVDPQVWHDIMQGVALRVRGEAHKPYDVVSVVKSLYWYLPYVGIEPRRSNMLALAMLVAGASVAFLFLWRVAKHDGERLGLVAVAGSALCIPAWYLLFLQHTAIHAFFMVRLLVWPITMMTLLVAMGLLRWLRPMEGRYGAKGAA